MPEFLIPALVFVAALCLGGAVLTAREARRARLRARLADLDYTTSVPSSGFGQQLRQLMEKLALLLAYGQPSSKLSQELARAGIHSQNAPYVYLGAKVLLLIVGLVGSALLLLFLEYNWTMVLATAVFGGLLLSFLPNVALNRRRSRRRAEIRQHLPDALDLLEICVTSGMGLDTAWNAVADEVRSVSPMLADEMALTNLELHLGAPRAQAMRKMAERTGAEEVSSLVAVLVQSERFGTSVRDALRTFAETMRERRSLLAQEAAEKIAVKLLFPLVVFIFPAVLVVVAGPAVLVLFQTILKAAKKENDVRRSVLLFVGVLLAAAFGCHGSNQQVVDDPEKDPACKAKHAQCEAECERDDDDDDDDDEDAARETVELTDRKETNSWMVRSIHDASKTEGLLAQRTIYPHYFVIDAAALNELGRREIDTLAKHYREYGGRLHVERADASDELYTARLASVADRLAADGVNPDRILRPDGRPGGAGVTSERMLLILRREAKKPGFGSRSDTSDEFLEMGSSGVQTNGASSGTVR